MKKYYILKEDGTSLFLQPYPEDFCFHCLVNLLDRSDERYRLCEIDIKLGVQGELPPVFAPAFGVLKVPIIGHLIDK